jgi:hypothetical protein
VKSFWLSGAMLGVGIGTVASSCSGGIYGLIIGSAIGVLCGVTLDLLGQRATDKRKAVDVSSTSQVAVKKQYYQVQGSRHGTKVSFDVEADNAATAKKIAEGGGCRVRRILKIIDLT